MNHVRAGRRVPLLPEAPGRSRARRAGSRVEILVERKDLAEAADGASRIPRCLNNRSLAAEVATLEAAPNLPDELESWSFGRRQRLAIRRLPRFIRSRRSSKATRPRHDLEWSRRPLNPCPARHRGDEETAPSGRERGSQRPRPRWVSSDWRRRDRMFVLRFSGLALDLPARSGFSFQEGDG